MSYLLPVDLISTTNRTVKISNYLFKTLVLSIFLCFILGNAALGQSFLKPNEDTSLKDIKRTKTKPPTSLNSNILNETILEARFTPSNTGENELSHLFISDIFVDSQDRLYVKTGFHHPTIDLYDGDNWKHFEPGKELPKFSDFAEDSNGNLWFIADKGILKYDSQLNLVDSLQINPNDTLSNVISNIAIDDSDRIWLTHEETIARDGNGYHLDKIGGISVYSIKNKELVARPDTLNKEVDNDIAVSGATDLLTHPNGTIWVSIYPTDSTSGGVAEITPDIDSVYYHQEASSNLTSTKITVMKAGTGDNIWTCFNPSGTASYNNDVWTTYTSNNSIIQHKCQSLNVNDDGTVYYGNSDTTLKYTDNHWQAFPGGIEKRPLVGITGIVTNFNGTMVFSQNTIFLKNTEILSGLFFKKNSDWDFISTYTDGGLFDSNIFGITKDNTGKLWFSGFYGVTTYDGSNWTYYSENDGIGYDYVWKIHAASNGTIWFGTTKNGITYLKNGEFNTVYDYGSFYGEIFEDSEGNIWISTVGQGDYGILKYDGNNFIHYTRTQSNSIGFYTNSFAEDKEGNIFAVGSEGLIHYNRTTNSWESWSFDPLKTINGYEIDTDINGNIWIANKDSLLKWDGNKYTSYAYPWKNFSVRDLEVDAEGRVWASSYGTYLFADSSWHRVNKDKNTKYWELPLNTEIYHASNGYTWVGSLGHGIYKYNRSKLLPIQQKQDLPQELKLYSNSPNPFNPTTTIRYQLPQAGHVELKVYNLMGRLVRTIVDKKQNAGLNSVTFNADNLSSGVYIYRLNLNGLSKSRKMLLVK